jgi:hypothetical protein
MCQAGDFDVGILALQRHVNVCRCAKVSEERSAPFLNRPTNCLSAFLLAS